MTRQCDETTTGFAGKPGGFGYLVAVSYDAAEESEAWYRSLRLLMDEVLATCNAELNSEAVTSREALA